MLGVTQYNDLPAFFSYYLRISRMNQNYSSPISLENGIASLVILKKIKNNKATYYLSLYAKSIIPVVDGNKVYVLFTDGSQFEKNTDIDCNAEENGFCYSAFFSITEKELEIFSTKTVKKIRLYIFDETIDSTEADHFRRYVKCIINAK